MAVLYHVVFARGDAPTRLHFLAVVRATDDRATAFAYHSGPNGEHYTPDRAAIRDALPTQHRKAFDRANQFWFAAKPGRVGLPAAPDMVDACSTTLLDRRGRLLGTLYAAPYIAG